MPRIFLVTASLLALAAAPLFAPAAAQPAAPPAADTAEDADAALSEFFADYDADQLAHSPTAKARRGVRDGDYGKWDDFSDAEAIREHEADRAALTAMRTHFAAAKLNPENQLSYRLFEKMIARRDAAFAFRDHEYVFDQMNGPHAQLPAFLINIHRVTDKADAEAYVRRLDGLGAAMDVLTGLSRAQAGKGMAPPKWVYPYVISDAQNVISGFPFTKIATEAPLYADIKGKIAKIDIPQREKDALLAAAADALIRKVKPAYVRLIAEMERQQTIAGTDDGVWRFKDGAAYYAERLSNYTTTDLTPDQIHQIGLDNVARIHGEMRAIMEKTGFKGDLPAFFTFMRTDKRFYASNDEAGRALYLAETEKAKAAVTAQLPKWFGVLPQAPLVVKPVEAFREKSAGKAFYQGPSPDGSRPGTYYVNLYDMADMPLFEVEALFYHEGLPAITSSARSRPN